VTTISGVSDEEMARLYGEAEIAVIPSLYEGFSLPAIEAMACGVAVVATTGGALPEVVGHEAGVLVEPNNPAALATAIATLLDDPDRRAAMGRAGRARVMERFTWEVTARGTAACYEAVLAGRDLPEAVDFR
jgi:glycosyltransferase involved in cell wall biosynthesis